MADTAKIQEDEILDISEGDLTTDNEAQAFALDAIDMTPAASPRVLKDVGRERVRFVAPIWVRGEGDTDDQEGVLLNLSRQGMACAVSNQMDAGERVWTRFRLGLASEPLKLLGEVLWRRPAQDATFHYGLRFLSLTESESSELTSVVDERVQGRAAEWSLPVIPETRISARSPRPTRLPALGVAAGVALMAIAGVWLLVPHGSRAAAPARVLPKVAPAVLVAVAPTPANAPTTANAPAEPAAAPVNEEPGNTVDPAPVRAVPTEKTPVAAKTPATPSSSKSLPRRASSEPSSTTDDTLRPLATRNSVELALLTDGPIDEHAEFWLENPQRLVVDILHRKSGFARLSYAIASPLVTKMRVGEHSDKVRFVIEASREASQEYKVRSRGNSLIIQFKHR